MKTIGIEKLKAYRNVPVVYFISDGQGHMKIGVASDIVTRLSNMQVGNANELQVVHLIEANDIAEAYEIETHIHGELSQSQIRGEWFPFDEAVRFLQGNSERSAKQKHYMADECPQFDIKDAIRLWTILLEEGAKSHTESEFVTRVGKRYDAEMPDYWKEFDSKPRNYTSKQ